MVRSDDRALAESGSMGFDAGETNLFRYPTHPQPQQDSDNGQLGVYLDDL